MNIRKFKDYRDFLKEVVEQRQETVKGFSFQSLASKLGTTRSYIKLIIDKKRHASLDKIVAISRVLKFTNFEKQYFIFLFLFNTCKEPEIKEFFLTILSSYSSYEKITLEEVSFENNEAKKILQHNWVMSAIFTLSQRNDYQSDPVWLQKMLGGVDIVSLKEISLCLRKMEEENLLDTAANTSAGPIDDPFIDYVKPFDINEFQRFKVGLQRTSLALDWTGKSQLHTPSRFQMYSLNFDKDQIEELIALYDDFQFKMLALAKKSKNPHKIMFMSNNVFPISADPEEL